jgi:ATP-dependent exoDNAse (exonuclease V) beta subunit
MAALNAAIASSPRPLRDEQYAEDAWADALLRERSLLYVAVTRARDELALPWSGDPSQLLPPAAQPD